jgi:hypothetical protein
MAALTMGVFRVMWREKFVATLASPGRISEYCGIRSTSSKVNPKIVSNGGSLSAGSDPTWAPAIPF